MFDHLFLGAFFSELSDLPSRPGARQRLYDIPRLYPHDSPMWNKGSQIMVKSTAQSIMQWLLNVPLQPQKRSSSVGFDATLIRPATEGQGTVSLVLKMVPTILSL